MKYKLKNQPVRGWNEPYIFVHGCRMKLSNDEARQTAVEFFAEIVEKEFGVSINLVKRQAEIKNTGDYKFMLTPVQGGKTQFWELTFKVDNGVYVIEEEFSKANSGVSHRQLLGSLLGELRDEERNFEDKARISFFTDAEWQTKIAKDIQDNKDTAEQKAEVKEVSDTLLNNFPQLFAAKYRQNICFDDSSIPNKGTISKLICPLPNGKKTYLGMGQNKKQAHIRAMMAAFADNILA